VPKAKPTERYEVFEKRYASFKDASEKAVDMALHSRESVAISCFDIAHSKGEKDHLTAYIIVTASLETP
jgi:hypothetical protein